MTSPRGVEFISRHSSLGRRRLASTGIGHLPDQPCRIVEQVDRPVRVRWRAVLDVRLQHLWRDGLATHLREQLSRIGDRQGIRVQTRRRGGVRSLDDHGLVRLHRIAVFRGFAGLHGILRNLRKTHKLMLMRSQTRGNCVMRWQTNETTTRKGTTMLPAKEELRHYLECLNLDDETSKVLRSLMSRVSFGVREAEALMTAFRRAEEVAKADNG